MTWLEIKKAEGEIPRDRKKKWITRLLTPFISIVLVIYRRVAAAAAAPDNDDSLIFSTIRRSAILLYFSVCSGISSAAYYFLSRWWSGKIDQIIKLRFYAGIIVVRFRKFRKFWNHCFDLLTRNFSARLFYFQKNRVYFPARRATLRRHRTSQIKLMPSTRVVYLWLCYFRI